MSLYIRDDYTVRRFLPADWRLYKQIRLEALQSDPAVFGSNFDKEFAYTDDVWQAAVSDPQRAMFGLFYEDTLIGVTGIVYKKDSEEDAALIASYIDAPHRGKGLSALLYQARLDWARHKGIKRVHVGHRISNTASKAANQKFGFQYTHRETKMWPDGIEADMLHYVLEL